MTAISRRSFIFSALALAACKSGAANVMLRGQTMGTTFTIVGVAPPEGVSEANLQEAVAKTLAAVDSQMSNWNPSSEISKINRARSGQSLPLSSEMQDLLSAALEVYQASNGHFDVTVGALVDLWGFGVAPATRTVPHSDAISAAQFTVGQPKLDITSGTLRKGHDNTRVYLSAIGKGFGVDRLGDVMRSFGFADFMVEIGGDIVTSGRNANGAPWQIAVESPDLRNPNVHKVIGLTDRGMATSGDYRNFFDVNGVRYSHIMDPHSGWPVAHSTTSVTVLAANAMLADAWATALLVAGTAQGMEIARTQKLAALFIDRTTSNGEKAFVTQASPEFDSLMPDL